MAKKQTEDFSGAQHLKGINFKKGMDYSDFSLLKKNIKRKGKQKQNQKKLLAQKISTALKDVVQIDDFENYKTPQSQRNDFIKPKKIILE